MTRAFLYVALAAGVWVLQTTAIQAEPVDSLQVKADKEEPGRISLPSTALQVSMPGTVKLTDAGVSGALLRATGTYSDRPGRQVHHRGPGRGRPSKWAVTDSTQVDSGGEGAGKRTLRRMAFGSAMTIAAGLIGVQQIRKDRDEDDGDYPGLEGIAAFWDYGTAFGWPVGVYLADPWESSFWMIAVGHGVAWWLGRDTLGAGWGVMGWTLIVSEASRSAPKGIRKPLQWLYGIL